MPSPLVSSRTECFRSLASTDFFWRELRTQGNAFCRFLPGFLLLIKDDLSRPETWTSSALSALRAVHQLLLQDYHCVEVDPLAQRPAAAANAPAAPQGAASPLQLPPLKSLARPDSSGPADGTAATSLRLPKQKRILQQIMPQWRPHVASIQAPPDDFCKHLRNLHLTQVIEAAPDAEAGDPRHSILTACMSDGDKSRKLHFTPAAWLSCLSTSDGVMAFTAGEWQNWFCSFLGVPLPSMLTLIANNRTCPCGRPYDAHAHHVHTCIHCNKTRAHNLLQDCLISLASDTDLLQGLISQKNGKAVVNDIHSNLVKSYKSICIDTNPHHFKSVIDSKPLSRPKPNQLCSGVISSNLKAIFSRSKTKLGYGANAQINARD